MAGLRAAGFAARPVNDGLKSATEAFEMEGTWFSIEVACGVALALGYALHADRRQTMRASALRRFLLEAILH